MGSAEPAFKARALSIPAWVVNESESIELGFKH
jgi:hypothetical protein